MSKPFKTSLHSLIILPGATVRYFCKDGLSSLSVMQVQKIFMFGGKMVSVNCGADIELIAL